MKNVVSKAVCILLTTLVSAQSVWAQEIPAKPVGFTAIAGQDHIDKLNDWREVMNMQFDKVFIPRVQEFTNRPEAEKELLIKTVKQAQAAINSSLDKTIRRYRQVFMEHNRDPEIRRQLLLAEGNTAAGTHIIYTEMDGLLDVLDRNRSKIFYTPHLRRINDLINRYKNDAPIDISFLEENLEIKKPFPKGNLAAVCSYITRFCIKNEKISKIIGEESLETQFLREGTQYEISEENREALRKLPRNAVVFIVPNHDYGPMDGRIVARATEMVGATRSMVLTTNDAYPHLKFRTLKDENVFFRQDKFYSKMAEQLRTHEGGPITMGIFPEGVIQHWNAQMPRTAKWGAFAYARRVAHELAGKKPVFLVRVYSNGIEHVTGDQPVNYKIRADKPIPVPSDAVGERDPWVIAQRAEFERLINEHRGRSQIDLINRGKIPGTNVRRSAPVRPYTPADGGRRVGEASNICGRILLN